MQETKQADDKFPEEAFAELGYESAHYGDGRWNGVAIISRVGLDDVDPGLRHVRRRARAPHRVGRVRRRPRVLGLRAQRPCPRQRVLRGEAGLAGPPAGHARPDVPARLLGRGLRRLQRRARRRRRLGSRRVRGRDARQRARARRAARRRGLGPRRRLPALQRARHLHVVGLPGGGLPPGPRHAHRPGPGERRLGHACHGAFRDRDARKGQKPSDHAPVVVDFADP